jgi:adhesin/invasin
LEVSPLRFADSAALGSRAARAMTLTLSNAAPGEVRWTATRLGASPWLSLGAASGTAPGTLTAAADPTGLAVGVYSDTIVVTARSPARGEARIPVQFAVHPCAVGPIPLDIDVAGRLDGADCAAPHRDATFADLYSFTGSTGDSVSVELESAEFTPYLILDTATTTSVPPLATSGTCAYAPGTPCLRYQLLPRSGTFVIEATTVVAGDSGAYLLRLLRPRPPSQVHSLAQLGGDSTTAIATGAVSADSTIVLRGAASDPDRGDSLRLEVEVRPVDAAFTGVPTTAGALVPAGGGAVARVSGLSDNTAYHWRARVVDQTGRASAWTGYGDNAESAADVSVAIADGPTAPTDLGQYKSDTLATIAVGGMTDERAAVFKGTVLDPDPDDSARLDVEIRVVGTPFSGAPSASSALVASGSVGTVAITGLVDNTSYHWQARAVDQSGRASAWVEFGGNVAVAPDLHVRVAPAQLVFTMHPGTTGSGAAIAPAVQVAAQDGTGNTLASFTGAVSIALGSNAAGGTLSGTQTVNAVAGVATFSDLRIDRAGSGYTLVASATGPAAATSDAFGITPGAAAQLAIMTQPSGTAPSGVAFTQQPVLQLLDAAGNAVSHDGVAVEAAIASGGGTLGGTTAVLTDASGVAAFTDLMITGPVGPHTLQFGATALTGVSSTVELIAGPSSQMSIQAGDHQVDTVSQTLPTALAVRVADQFNNPVSNVQISWAVLDGGGSVNPLSSLTDANGIATTSWTLGTAMTPTDSVQLVQATGVGLPLTFTAFTVPGPVSASQTSVMAFPATITTSTGGSASTLTVTARDQFGNPIEGATVVLAATGSGTTLTQPGTTDAGGVGTGTLSATAAGDKVVSATIGGTGITQTATVTVTPAGVSAALSTVAASPGSITAGSGVATITVTARDQFGNPLEGTAVVLTVTGTGNTVTQPGTTDASGMATGTLSATGAGDKVVSATIGGTGITQIATVTVTPAGVSAGHSTVTAAPDAITAGSEVATITVTARDAFGNPIDGATVVLAALGSGTTLTQPLGLTSASGVATGTLAATAAGDKEVSATIAGTGVTQTATVTVTAAAVSGVQSTVTASPGSITAGSGVATITVTARDGFGNPVDDATVVLAATGTGNTLTQPVATNENGVATGMLSATVAEGKTISVTIEGTAVTQTASVTVEAAGVDAARSTVVAAPTAITASNGASSATITVTARDPFGNPIQGATVVLAASGSGNTLTQPGATTNTSGHATGALSATVAEGKAVSVTINGTGITQTATVTVTPSGVSAAQSTVAAAPASITAGSGTATITVTVRDQFGNPIEGAAVVLTATGAGNALTQPGGTTNASGQATGTLSATTAEPKLISATISGTGITQTATVTVTPAGVSAAQSTVAASPGSITAGSGVTSITVTARDAFGNPLEGATVVLAATGGGNTLTQPLGLTNASGVAMGTLSATTAEPKIISATIADTEVTQTATVTVTAAGVSAALSTLAASPGTITVGSGVATIAVTARDAFGNPIEGVTVVLAVSGTGNTLTQPGTTTDASGVATGALSATAAEDKVVSATIATTAVTQTATVTVLPTGVSAGQSMVVAAPPTITASNGTSSATITVTARDAFGNPIQGVTVVLAASGSGNTLTQPATTTDASGQATGTLSATAAGDKVVSATIAGTGVTQTATVTVTAAGVSAAQSTVAASPGSITAGSGVATITVTARDAFGNPIGGATVELAATGDGNTLTPPGTTTNASGQATGTLSATTAELKLVSATIAGTGVTQTATVTVEAADVDAAQSTVVAAPPTITASSGASSATITVTARDQFGNPIQGATVLLAATGSGNTLSQPLGATSASGVTTGTLSATVAEGKTVSVTIDGTGVTQTATVTVTAADVSAAQSTVAASPGSIMTGTGVATITVTARDAFGNPIEGATVVLAVTGTGNSLTQPGTTTDASGVATGTLTATAAGDKVVSATIAGTGVTQTATVTAAAAGVSAVQSTVAAAPASITAGSGVATITVTARDAFGNPIEGATVILAASGAGNTLTQPGTTNSNGVATGTLSATAAESKTVTASVDGLTITQQASVLVTPAAAHHLVFLVEPTSVTAGATMTPRVEVEIRDQFTNRVAGATNAVALAIATNPGGGTLTGGDLVAAVDGVASFASLSVDKASLGYTLAASSPGLTGATSAAFTVTAGALSPAQSTVVAAPGSIPVGSGVSTITVTAKDANDNPIEGATVVLAVAGTATLLTQPAGQTAADGTATGTLSATLSGTKVVSAVINGTPIVQTASVTVQPPPGSVVFVGAGDIGDCEWPYDEATATLLDGIPGTVFTAGDNAYPNGTASDFTNCYEPTWGRHKARTYPSPGNHDYRTSGASAYYAYFGANAGPAGRGYYSYDLGDWHIISLNSEISMSTSSAQVLWLRADLAANTKQCTLAYWHKPLFSSGEHGSLSGSKPLWKALQEYNAEVVVVGHDHNYERFAPQDTIGVADLARGLRQFVVGTGGTDLRGMNPLIANSEVANSDTHGVLKLTLHGSGYEWEFIPVAGQTFTDSGSGSCH